MGLKNFQYNRILREYDKRQLENKHRLDTKYQEIYRKIPSIKELDDAIASHSVAQAKLAIMGEEDAIENLRIATKDLSEQKTELLLAHGYPCDYLTLTYTCPNCKDTGFQDQSYWKKNAGSTQSQTEERFLLSTSKCHCFKQAMVDLLYQQSNMKISIAKENFSTFSFEYYRKDYVDETIDLSPYDNMVKVVTVCQKFIETFDHTFQNLLFYGNAGVGKTFLTNCIAKELLDSAHTVIYLTSFQLFDILEKNKFSKEEDRYETQEQFRGILDCDLLIVDDLGTELNNSFISSQLYLCINERHLSQKSTIISTNLSIDDLSRQYSERIFSRITSDYTLLKIIGDDIRLKKAFAP